MTAGAYVDACGFLATSTGTVDFVVASALTGYQSPATAGAVNATVYSYRAQSADLSQWEEGYGAYTTASVTLARTTVTANSSGGTTKISFTAAPNVFIVAATADLSNASLLTSGTLPAARIAFAVKSDQTTATSTTLPVNPAIQQNHPSAAKFWIYVTVSAGTPTNAASYNVTSITDTGVGDLTVTLTTSFTSANWSPQVSLNSLSTTINEHYYKNVASGSIELVALNVGVATVDPVSWSVSGHGTQ